MKTFIGSLESGFIEVEAGFPGAIPMDEQELAALQRQSKIRRIGVEFDAEISLGFHDEETGITVAIGDNDRVQFDALDSQLRRLNAPDEMPLEIADINGRMWSITVGVFRGLITRGGMYYMALWKQRKEAEAALQPPGVE